MIDAYKLDPFLRVIEDLYLQGRITLQEIPRVFEEYIGVYKKKKGEKQ